MTRRTQNGYRVSDQTQSFINPKISHDSQLVELNLLNDKLVSVLYDLLFPDDDERWYNIKYVAVGIGGFFVFTYVLLLLLAK